MEKISAVYKIVNEVTGDFYIGSSRNVYRRWKEHLQSDKGKEVREKANKKYNSQLCLYNGETLTLKALLRRFQRARIEHATLEAKKYILNGSKHFMNTIR